MKRSCDGLAEKRLAAFYLRSLQPHSDLLLSAVRQSLYFRSVFIFRGAASFDKWRLVRRRLDDLLRLLGLAVREQVVRELDVVDRLLPTVRLPAAPVPPSADARSISVAFAMRFSGASVSENYVRSPPRLNLGPTAARSSASSASLFAMNAACSLRNQSGT